MKFTKLLMACGAAAMFPYQSFLHIDNKRPGLVAPRYSKADSECSERESRRCYQAALDKRKRRADKLRRLEERNG
jgi:hypothetical protein